MVDPKQTDERTVETEAGLQAARKVWVTPRLETADLTENTAGSGNTSGEGALTSVS